MFEGDEYQVPVWFIIVLVVVIFAAIIWYVLSLLRGEPVGDTIPFKGTFDT